MTEEKKVRPKIVWCKPCNGQGWCMVKEVPFECMCGHLKRVAAGMLPYIKLANVEREHVRLPIVRRSRDNLFIEGHWNDMCAIVKILMMTGTNGHVKIADENELRDVYVGSFSKASKSSDFTGVVYNSISDFVGPPDLLIIRLNTLTNKNKAVPGVLLESVKTRYDYGKSTWLLSDVERPFNPHSLSYSDEAGVLIASAFEKVVLPKINQRESEQVQSFFMTNAISPLALEAEPSQRAEPERGRGPKIGHDPEAEPERKPRRKQEPEDESVGGLGSIYGAGVSNSKTKFRK
jgi:hypothetical protein